MPDENKKKKSEEKKQELTVEATVGITNELPVVYTSGNTEVNEIEAAHKKEFLEHIETTVDCSDNQCVVKNCSTVIYGGDVDLGNNNFNENTINLVLEGTQASYYKYDFQKLFDVNIQRAVKKDSENCVSDMKQFIKDNISSSPENVQIAIATLQTALYQYYDEGTNNWLHASGFTRKDLGNTSEEIFEKIYNTPEGEMLEGFVCSTISDFTMRLLHECDIEAVMFCGGNYGSDHTTLLYKQEEGKYVYVDNGKFTVIESGNIKDAAKAAHRSLTSPGDFGYIMFVDENNSYQEYDLVNESVWGYELDKRDYNQSIAELPVINCNSSVKANYNKSLIGGNDINVAYTTVNNDGNAQNELSLAFKNNRFNEYNTYSYNSLGIKYEKDRIDKKDNNTALYSKNKSILALTKIDNNVQKTENEGFFNYYEVEYDEESRQEAQNCFNAAFDYQTANISEEDLQFIQEHYQLELDDYTDSNEYSFLNDRKNNFYNFMLFNRNEIGKHSPISENLSTTGQLSSTIGLNLRPFDGLIFCGDLRLTAEQSLNYNKTAGRSEINANINGGVVADMSIKTGVLKPGIAFGAKGNANVSVMTRLNDNLSAGANVSGYTVITPVSTDCGAMAGVGIKYQNNNRSIFGNINSGYEYQQLHIGRLNENTENNMTLNASLGTTFNNTTIQAGYTTKLDKLNQTKNRSMLTLGVSINF